MSIKLGSIIFDGFEFDKIILFWQKALHYQLREPISDE